MVYVLKVEVMHATIRFWRRVVNAFTKNNTCSAKLLKQGKNRHACTPTNYMHTFSIFYSTTGDGVVEPPSLTVEIAQDWWCGLTSQCSLFHAKSCQVVGRPLKMCLNSVFELTQRWPSRKKCPSNPEANVEQERGAAEGEVSIHAASYTIGAAPQGWGFLRWPRVRCSQEMI